MTDIDFEKIYHSNNSGDFKIIEDLGVMNNSRRFTIQFINTGHIKNVLYENLITGNVSDPKNYKSLNIDNTIYNSNNYGKFIIIKDLGTDERGFRLVKIRFIDTGYESNVYLNSAKSGQVKDPYKKSVYGVGYLGDAKSTDNNELYKIWCGILSRCYNKNDTQYKNYGAIGITVSEDWLCYANFLRDAKLLDGYENKKNDRYNYQIDKDLLQLNVPKSERIYSKDTCVWLSNRDNCRLRSIDNSSNGLIGVYKIGNLYYPEVYVNGEQIFLGSYIDEITAYNVYNNYNKLIGLNNFLNDVPVISADEIVSKSYSMKEMIKKIDK